jgi:shikimate kinase
VINRLITQDNKVVLGTGGGAFIDQKTRGRLMRQSIVIWLKVDVDLLVERTSKRDTRPLLKKGNPRKILSQLAKERYPVYDQAHIVVQSGQGPHDKVVNDIIWKLNKYLAAEKKKYQKRQAKQKAQAAEKLDYKDKKTNVENNEKNNS